MGGRTRVGANGLWALRVVPRRAGQVRSIEQQERQVPFVASITGRVSRYGEQNAPSNNELRLDILEPACITVVLVLSRNRLAVHNIATPSPPWCEQNTRGSQRAVGAPSELKTALEQTTTRVDAVRCVVLILPS